MKSIYRKHVRAQMDEVLVAAAISFEPVTFKLTKEQRRSFVLFPGSWIYRRRVSNELHLFLHIIPDQKQERFLLEIGWSLRGRFPFELSGLNNFMPADKSELQFDEYLVDFGQLYHRTCGKGFIGWNVWECSEEFPQLDASRLEDADYKVEFESHLNKWREACAREDLVEMSDEEARDRSQVAVSKFIADVKTVALPYFDDVIALKGERD